MNIKFTLLTVYCLLFSICAVSPYDRSVWFAENIPIVILVGFIIWVSKHFNFSTTSYLFMSVLPFLHTIGGHYTFERVPFDYVTELFGFERNNYDRIAHFSVGFYAYAISEFVSNSKLIQNRVLVFVFSVCAIFAVASVYEILEWWYALFADSESGIAVLGAQGDIWDAQKDMLADGLGAFFAASLYALKSKSNQTVVDNSE